MTVGASASRADRRPYVGTRPFRSEDSHRFFGRAAESHKLTALWQANRLTVLCGPSGVGKTSVLRAGSIPLLEAAGADVLPVGRVAHGSAFPMAALPEHNPFTLALLSSWSPEEAATGLSGLTIYDFLRRRGERVDHHGDPLPVLASIDCAEELFSDLAYRNAYRKPFIDELTEALDEQPRLHLLLSIREDAAIALAPFEPDLGRGAQATFRLNPLGPEAALEAICRPLDGTGRLFTPEAAAELIGRLRRNEAPARGEPDGTSAGAAAADIEPALLQVVCAKLWEALPADVRVVTPEQLRRYGDVGRLLAEFCTQATAEVADDHELAPAKLRSWLHRTFVTELGTRGTAYEGLTTTAGMPNAVARALEDRHVLKAVRRSGSRWYELQHDCLVEPVRLADGTWSAEVGVVPAITPADYLRAAELAIADGDLALARRHAAEALRSADNTDLRLCAEAESLLGNVAHAFRQPKEAEARYRAAAALFEALQDTPAVARLLAAIGQSLLAQGRNAEAVEELRAAVDRMPNDLTVQTGLGWALWHLGQQRAAVAILTGVLAIDGGSPDALRARGEILADLGDAEGALRDLDRVRKHPRPSTRAARALALATLRDLRAADPEIDAALTNAPDNGPVLLYAARVGALGGDRAAAADLARRAVAATEPALPHHQREQAIDLLRAGTGDPDGADGSPA